MAPAANTKRRPRMTFQYRSGLMGPGWLKRLGKAGARYKTSPGEFPPRPALRARARSRLPPPTSSARARSARKPTRSLARWNSWPPALGWRIRKAFRPAPVREPAWPNASISSVQDQADSYFSLFSPKLEGFVKLSSRPEGTHADACGGPSGEAADLLDWTFFQFEQLDKPAVRRVQLREQFVNQLARRKCLGRMRRVRRGCQHGIERLGLFWREIGPAPFWTAALGANGV